MGPPCKLVVPELIDGIVVTAIDSNAFRNARILEISLPNTIDTIGDNAFYGSDLRELTLPSSLQFIGQNVIEETDETDLSGELACAGGSCEITSL